MAAYSPTPHICCSPTPHLLLQVLYESDTLLAQVMGTHYGPAGNVAAALADETGLLQVGGGRLYEEPSPRKTMKAYCFPPNAPIPCTMMRSKMHEPISLVRALHPHPSVPALPRPLRGRCGGLVCINP